MGSIRSDINWLSDPKVAEAISGDEDYLSYLGDPTKKVAIYYAIKGGSTKVMQSLTRMVVGIAQLQCVHAGKGNLPLFYLEEAATCGKAHFIPKAVSEYRKYFTTILIYQSLGQIEYLFGKAGASEIMDSCGLQIFLGGGIRDITSAKRIAESVGKRTIWVDDLMQQYDRYFKAQRAHWEQFWDGADTLDSAAIHDHELFQSQQQRQAGRYAIDPAELMRLKDEILVLAPGMGVKPLLAHKLIPYWENPVLAGCYGPDPLFPPLDSVTIKKRFFGKAHKDFITADVPHSLSQMPNHINGRISYVDGYKTF